MRNELSGSSNPTSNAKLQDAADNVEELFLLRLRYKEGRSVRAEGNRPIFLTDPGVAWVVYSGRLDVFAVPMRDGEVSGHRSHLMRVEPGQALFGIACDPDLALLGVGDPGAEVVKLPRARLHDLFETTAHAADVTRLLDRWIERLSDAIVRTAPPNECVTLDPGTKLDVTANGTVRARRGTVWVRGAGGPLSFLGGPDLPEVPHGVRLPLTRRTWVASTGEARVESFDTETLLKSESLWADLDYFHELALKCVRNNRRLALEREAAQLLHKNEAGRAIFGSALARVATVMDKETMSADVGDALSDPLLAACRLVGNALGVDVKAPPIHGGRRTDPLTAIARASHFRLRRVQLKDGWWRQANEPLLGYSSETGHPVALIPSGARRYVAHDAATGSRTPVTAAVAQKIAPGGYVFYRPFPPRPMTLFGVVRFGAHGRRRDLVSVVLTGAAGALLGLLMPIAVGLLMGSAIPTGDRSLLVQLGLGLVAAALGGAVFVFTRGIAILRVQGTVTAPIQAAVWDRLLSLPARFFRGYSAGDLANRALSIRGISQLLSGITVTSLLSALFSLFGFGLLFYYDPGLAGLAALSVAGVLAVTIWISLKQLRGQRQLLNLEGEISGVLFQLLTGIAKLRATGMERSAFKMWAEKFAEQRKIAFAVRTKGNQLAVFSSTVPLITGIVLFAAVALRGLDAMPAAVFLAFHAAFGQVLAGMLALNSVVASVLTIVPMTERVKPILQAVPEVDTGRKDPGGLQGNIELARVSFRYEADGPLILNDVRFRVNPGEFVAVVGPSGSGKSTLLRLLLGFETPERGGVYYDGQDLSRLDLVAVRHQIGVVLQHAQLMPGDIFRNIVGSAPLSLDDAWEAARLVGLDEEIRGMPMGMHTVIGEGGGGFSGGQRQRLLIARAIVSKPRILLFDEATSALDNRTQEQVRESLDSLQATRIVVAHRLSTIVHADRIYVMQAGRVAQVGTYDELVKEEGLFAGLARRQLA